MSLRPFCDFKSSRGPFRLSVCDRIIGVALVIVLTLMGSVRAAPARSGGGACCVNGGCSIYTSQSSCESDGGAYAGDGTDCTNNNPCPIGACCHFDDSSGINICEEVDQYSCENLLSGLYSGDNTDCENDSLCPKGACCDKGECELDFAEDCLFKGNIYAGDYTDCEHNDPCPTGACCVNGNCRIDSFHDCHALGGFYAGNGSDCSGNPCPTGSCCVGGECFLATAEDCANLKGNYAGDFTDCESNPCSPTDADGDGVPDNIDNCVNAFNPDQADRDHDGVGDVCDNCPSRYNPSQVDSNHNGRGDACDPIRSPISVDRAIVDDSTSTVSACGAGTTLPAATILCSLLSLRPIVYRGRRGAVCR